MSLRTILLAVAAVVFVAAGGSRLTEVQAQGNGASLPDGPGKTIVENACSACHGLDLITGGGRDADGWRATVERMMEMGAVLSDEQVPVVTSYLAANFPATPRPAGTNSGGDARVSIKEWDVPTRGSHPHDPLAAADGSLWWTGQYANVLGRLDPKTGQMKEFPLKTPDSGPHGLVEDRSGNIWFTANSQGYIGKLDPKTGTVTEYKLSDPAARDPHTPIFDRRGMLWFTVQGGNMIGRLNPETGEIKLVTSKTPRSNPYGIVINSAGVPFLVLFGTNKIASLDPATMAITEYTLPHADTRPRRIAITDDDVIWYTDYSRGYLGRFDPKSGRTSEWPSPGGPRSQPYGITAAKGVIWYSESGVAPNTLVRFDPKTEKFQTVVIPSGGGVVRHMMATREGNLALACSGVDKVALVSVQ